MEKTEDILRKRIQKLSQVESPKEKTIEDISTSLILKADPTSYTPTYQNTTRTLLDSVDTPEDGS